MQLGVTTPIAQPVVAPSYMKPEPEGHSWYPEWRHPWTSTYGTFNTMGAAMARHALNNLGGLGLQGATWGVRDAYRSRYSEHQRFGGQAGDLGTIPLVGLLAAGWISNGAKTPEIFRVMHIPNGVTRAVIGTWMAGAVLSAAKRTHDNAIDEGDLGMTGAVVGAVGTAAAAIVFGKRLPGRVLSKVALGGGAVAGGYIGNAIGAKIDTGTRHIGDQRPVDPAPTLRDKPVLAFTRGLVNHGLEMSPLTQGASSGTSWHRRDAMQDWYSDAEIAGGMIGDGMGVPVASVAALVGANRVLGRSEAAELRRTRLAQMIADLGVPGRLVGRLKDLKTLITKPTPLTEKDFKKLLDTTATPLGWRQAESVWRAVRGAALRYNGRVPELLYLSGAALAVMSLDQAKRSGGRPGTRLNENESLVAAGVGLVGLTAAIAQWAPETRTMPMIVRPGASFMIAAALTAAAFSLRDPVETFLDGRDELQQRRGGVTFSATSALAVGVGGIGGAMVGRETARLMQSPAAVRNALMGAAALVGAFGLVSLTPMIDQSHQPVVSDDVNR